MSVDEAAKRYGLDPTDIESVAARHGVDPEDLGFTPHPKDSIAGVLVTWDETDESELLMCDGDRTEQ